MANTRGVQAVKHDTRFLPHFYYMKNLKMTLNGIETEKMTKPSMPDGERGGGQKGAWLEYRWMDGVELPEAIAPDDHVLRSEILHRKTKRVKFDRTIIVNGELANRNKVLNDARRNKNVVQK